MNFHTIIFDVIKDSSIIGQSSSIIDIKIIDFLRLDFDVIRKEFDRGERRNIFESDSEVRSN